MTLNLSKPNTKNRIILDYLNEVGSCTVEQAQTQLADQLTPQEVSATVIHLRSSGRVILDDGEIDLSDAMRIKMRPHAKKVEVLSIVPPRVVNVMTSPPLSKSLYINTKGTRPDSDWSQFKSRQL